MSNTNYNNYNTKPAAKSDIKKADIPEKPKTKPSGTKENLPGEAEYNKYINTQIDNQNVWECARLLKRAAAAGYPDAVAEYKRVRRSEIGACFVGVIMYSPFFAIPLFLLIGTLVDFLFAIKLISIPAYLICVAIVAVPVFLYHRSSNPWL